MQIESVAVFCGSNNGQSPLFSSHAAELGKLIALLSLKLIYGGGNKGLMKVLADAALQHNGHVIGIIPGMLTEREHQHQGLSELMVVPDMHTRKKMMYELCDAAIVLPGGFGTLDEMFEMLTWNQLKIHDKKLFVLNSGGYFRHLQQHLLLAEKEGFLYEALSERIHFCDSPVEIFNRID
ncbi:MAG TPA: TIGR00730 family Rossman fold protein [Chitinophagaceae bacterium]|jgi:uncharacterized protein (TIGR00730 family)|nr:TIGR00730 family Rossman fold protein [Chitinophagaceae bacterium]